MWATIEHLRELKNNTLLMQMLDAYDRAQDAGDDDYRGKQLGYMLRCLAVLLESGVL